MRRLRRKRILFFLGILLILIFVGSILYLIKPGKNIFNPIFSGVYWFEQKFDDLGIKFADKENLIKQNKELQEKIIELSIDSAQLDACVLENENLKQQLNFIDNENYSVISGRVIGKLNEFAGAQMVYVFNRGEHDGIEVGAPLVLSGEGGTEGILVGKIIKADYARSYFILTQNYHSSIAGVVLNDNEESSCLVVGSRDNVMQIELLPVNKSISRNDLIITSGLEKNIPRGLLIGRVSLVENDQGALFYRIKLDSLIATDDFSVLSVIVSTDEVSD